MGWWWLVAGWWVVVGWWWMVGGGWLLVVGWWWLVGFGGWWLVVVGWFSWLVVGGGWLVVGGWLVGAWCLVGVPGRTSPGRILFSTKYPAYHANHTGTAAATQRPQGVHPNTWRAASNAPATQITPAQRRRQVALCWWQLVAFGAWQLVGDNYGWQAEGGRRRRKERIQH